MALGFLFSLFGCSKSKDHGSWTSFVVSNVSPDRRDSYSFRVNKAEDGGMLLFGYCNDDETEYRSDEGVVLSSRIADMLRDMEIEKLPVKEPRRKFSLGKVPDTVERLAQVTYEDGAELGLILSNEQREAIVSLLNDALTAAKWVEMHGEWTQLFLDFRNDDYSAWYDFEVSRNDAGEWIAKGYCTDQEQYRRETEDGIVLSPETIEAIRGMNLDRYAAVRKAKPDPEFEDVFLLDGESGGLTLGYADGYITEKATPNEVDYAIAELLKKEFAEKADKQ